MGARLNDEFRFVIGDGRDSYDDDSYYRYNGRFDTDLARAKDWETYPLKIGSKWHYATKRFLEWPKLRAQNSRLVAPTPQENEDRAIYKHLKRYLTLGDAKAIDEFWMVVGKA